MEEIEQIQNTIFSFHRIIIIFSTLIMIGSAIAINHSNYIPNYQILTSHQVFVEQIQMQFSQILSYLSLMESLIININNSSDLLSPMSVVSVSTILSSSIYEIYNIESFIKCLSPNCDNLNIKSLGDIVWQFKLSSYLWIDSIYISAKQGSVDSLFVVPLIQQAKNDFSIANISSQWGIWMNQSELYITKNTKINDNLSFKVITHINRQMMYSSIDQMISKMNDEFRVRIDDNIGWLNYSTGSSQQYQHTINIQIKSNDSLLLSFILHYAQPSNLRILSNKNILSVIPFVMILLVVYLERKNVRRWFLENFKQIDKMDKLMIYNIGEMVEGRDPQNIIILDSNPIASIYSKFSLILTNAFFPKPILHIKNPKKQLFAFQPKLQSTLHLYKAYIANIHQQKYREIIGNKFNIHTSMDEMYENISQQLKAAYNQFKSISCLQSFFQLTYQALFQYHSLFSLTIQQSPNLPSNFYLIVTNINQILNGENFFRYFRINQNSSMINQNISQLTYEELKIRIQTNLLLKFLLLLKDLDTYGEYTRNLGMEKQVWKLGQQIENIRYLMEKHNKILKENKYQPIH